MLHTLPVAVSKQSAFAQSRSSAHLPPRAAGGGRPSRRGALPILLNALAMTSRYLGSEMSGVSEIFGPSHHGKRVGSLKLSGFSRYGSRLPMREMKPVTAPVLPRTIGAPLS